jgi:hypothetical protein
MTTHLCSLALFALLLLTSCGKKSKKSDDPCAGVICGGFVYFLPCQCKLVEPGTDHNLVHGAYARISPDSIWLINSAGAFPLKQRIDTSGIFSIGSSLSREVISLEIRRPGKITHDNLTLQSGPYNCCQWAVHDIWLNENPVRLKRDSAGVFLVPYIL